ncbi:class I SAM-dependent methyltransferase [Amylibacter sp. SFDW26]|uniref:class I SAM-dependent methyltransferase n=1 Tax=Amylibacter sp. SFDW26 TaxID=2652722 RepID=UPI001D003AA5|nr:class I SAM-dependent methyltransferase [Amylibacter sp. SFDW26]
MFVSPMLDDQLDLIYPSNYYAFGGAQETLAQKIKNYLDLRLFRKITDHFPQNTALNILDVGGGDGWLLDLFKQMDRKFGETWVVDLDQKAQEKAIAKGHNFHLGPIEMFTYDGKFDVILMLNLIEHVKDPRAVLLQIKSLLSGNGCVLIKTPNFNSLDAKLFKNNNWGGFHTPRHFVLFTQSSFESLAQEVGLKVTQSQLTQGAPFWAVSVTALAQKYGLIKVDYSKGMHRHWLYKVSTLLGAAFDILRGPFSDTSQMFITLSHSDDSKN